MTLDHAEDRADFTLAQLDDNNALVVSIQTEAVAVNFTGATLDGALAPGAANATMRLPQYVTCDSAANAGSYVAGTVITVTGTLWGTSITDTMTVVGTGGGESLRTTSAFSTVTNIHVPAQVNTGGDWEFGVEDIGLAPPRPGIALRWIAAGNIQVVTAGGMTEVVDGDAGETQDFLFTMVDRTNTTATSVGVFVGRSHSA